MAGSYGHVVDDEGRLRTNERVVWSLENGGDVCEAVEEMYGMIHWLANRISEVSGIPRSDLIAEAVERYEEGVLIGGRQEEGEWEEE